MSHSDRQRAALRGRPFFLFVVAAAVALLLSFVLPRRSPPPSVLLITIDTLRADVIDDEMPALAALARRGLRFRRARTPAPLTLPAHATLLSGLQPARHGIRDNTAPPLPERAARDYPLLAEEFRGAGYATAAFVAAGVLDPRYRLDAGFDEYRHPPAPARGAPFFPSLDASEQVARFTRWHAARPADQPYFAWVHLWEPHAPYRPYAGDERRAGTAATDPAAERYRGEVRKADAALEALLALVDPATTLVVVTSDHGESLGEHGEATHGHLCYGPTMDVPLVLAGPGIDAGNDRNACSLADVAPTLRALCDLPAHAGDGLDLRALPRGRVVVGESLYAYRRYGWAQQLTAFDGRFALVDGGPRVELFDRIASPGEEEAVEAHGQHVAFESLDTALQEYRRRGDAAAGEALAAPHSPYGSLTRDESAFLPAAANRALRDVRDHLGSLAPLHGLDAAIAAGDAALVRRLLPAAERLERDDPQNPAPSFARGRALLFVLDRPAEAAPALRRAYERGYRGALLPLEAAYRLANDAEGLAWVVREGKKPPR